MSRLQDATPCPTSILTDNLLDIRSDRQRDSFDQDDTTSKIDFTTEFQASFRTAGVKRRATMMRPRRTGTAMNFAVHQDDGLHSTEYHSGKSKRHAPTADKLSILAQPAQRPRSKLSFTSGNTNSALSGSTTTTGNSHQVRSAINTDMKVQASLGKTMEQVSAGGSGIIKKSSRRGTLYIPSEDTTMPTVWMSIFSPIKDVGAGDGNSVGDRPADLTGIAAQMDKKRAARKSSVSAAPRRAPLRHSLRPPQETMISEDIPGRMTGKENLPPGHQTTGNKKVQKKKPLGHSSHQPQQAPRRPAFDNVKRSRPASCGTEHLPSKVGYSSQSAQNGGLHRLQARVSTAPEHDVNGNFARLRLNEGEKKAVPIPHSNEALRMTPQLLSAGRTKNVPTKIMVPNVARPLLDPNYALLSEDIQNSSLYENNWLAHQEIAITQLVNNLFDGSQARDGTTNILITRSQLLTIYQDQAFVFLQKRLQASLLYGTLALPKEILTKSSRLPEDLGMKQNFLNLWLNTYNLQILEACAEVVIGRECSSSPGTSSTAQTSAYSPQRTVSRQNLSRYLDMFLIRNEDVVPESGMLDPGTTGVQRTLLRSLMLIKLLDSTKSSPGPPFSSCLLQPSSPYKSSVDVVQALAQMLHPATGNIMRSLSHLSYSVNHVQYPLEEYDYHINNLAADLRDGVKLTRLVEKLLYPSASRLLIQATDGDATTTITMPTGEILLLMQGEQEWPLSQHLKVPCLGRATKLYNVRIALNALAQIAGVGKMVEDIEADDIVDGYREKTVVLLWGLTSKWGLGSLIDWTDLKHEIRRLGGTLEEDDEEHGDDLAQYKTLLKEWASAAAARKRLKVNNLSTSFADGKVFEAIVDEYEPYLHASKSSSNSGPRRAKRQLSQRLADLGCSAQFGKHKHQENFLL